RAPPRSPGSAPGPRTSCDTHRLAHRGGEHLGRRPFAHGDLQVTPAVQDRYRFSRRNRRVGGGDATEAYAPDASGNVATAKVGERLLGDAGDEVPDAIDQLHLATERGRFVHEVRWVEARVVELLGL